MRGSRLFKVLGVCCFSLTMGLGGCGKKKVGEGKRCRKHKDCKGELKCVNTRCTDFSGKSKACQWSLSCLRKLADKFKRTNHGYEVTRWYKKLSKAPYKSDCLEMPKRVAFLFGHEPYKWKTLCGPPPVPGVKQVTNRSNPFRIRDKQVKASNIPSDEKKSIHEKHLAYPDVCKGWAEFELTRPFQGWVIAKFYEQYNCKPVSKEEKKKDPQAKPKCDTKIYARDDRRYLNLHPSGSIFSINFYVSTPPEVCKKPNLTEDHYKSGCFCLGLDETKLDLEFVDDPFFFYDVMRKPKKRR